MEKIGSKLTSLTDKQLITLALSKDEGAFSILLTKYKSRLLSHIQSYVPNLEDAEDICQRSFEKVFMNLDKYNSNFAFSTWLYNIAQNEAIDHIRRNRLNINSISLTDNSEIYSISHEDTPEDILITDQAMSELLAGINQLPLNYKDVSILRFIRDYAYEDISIELNIPLGTVKTRLNRARKLLTKIINK